MPLAPVKNTFIHYDEAAEAPSKLRRNRSAPAALCVEAELLPKVQRTSDSVGAANVPVPVDAVEAALPLPKVQCTSDLVEDLQLVPARKKARVVSGEDETGIQSKQLYTHLGEDQRSRNKTRIVSRSQPKDEVGGGNVSKELTEQERYEKATEWISKMKDTVGYQTYLGSRKRGEKKSLAAPRTPDPRLRITSKRKWERAIMSWRISLRQYGPVTVSAEDEQ